MGFNAIKHARTIRKTQQPPLRRRWSVFASRIPANLWINTRAHLTFEHERGLEAPQHHGQ